MACTGVTQYGEVQGGAVRGGQQVGLQVINVIIDSVKHVFNVCSTKKAYGCYGVTLLGGMNKIENEVIFLC